MNLIDHLPAHSFLVEAQANDPELAERVAAGEQAEASPPRVAEWDSHLAELTYIADLLARMLDATVAGNGGKPPRIASRPRPETEIDRARRRAMRSQHEALVARLLPG